jgi:hypothetical protein
VRDRALTLYRKLPSGTSGLGLATLAQRNPFQRSASVLLPPSLVA